MRIRAIPSSNKSHTHDLECYRILRNDKQIREILLLKKEAS